MRKKMKKLLFILCFLVLPFVVMSSCSDDDDDRIISVTDLPSNAQQFLQTHFPDVKTSRVEEDNDSYDVYLSNGYEVDFDKKGEWDNVDGNNKVLPESFLLTLPSGIIEYVKANYSNNFIDEVDKEINGYEVGLNNNVDLLFNSDGTFRGIDR